MTQKLRIRVSLEGKSPAYELLHNGVKVCDLTYIEVLEFALQATSSLRWIERR